jgi:FkbM family methyltransferase
MVIKETFIKRCLISCKMSTITKLAHTILPEGKIKDYVKQFYRSSILAKNSMSFTDPRIKFYSDEIVFKFRKGVLAGQEIRFPNSMKKELLRFHIEIPPYFPPKGLSKENVIIDAGAFPGEFTVLASQQAKKGLVVAFEPEPSNRKKLEEVVKLNGAQNNIIILPYALSNNDGLANIISKGQESSVYRTANGSNSFNSTIIEMRRLDTLIEGLVPLKKPGTNIFVKMDIEGEELNAIKGAEKTITYGAKFAIASYHEIDSQKTAFKLSETFINKGYLVRIINPGHLTLMAEPKFPEY